MPANKPKPALKSAARANVRKAAAVSRVSDSAEAEESLTPGEIAARNPYRFFNNDDIGQIFGFGKDVVTKIRKVAPHLIVANSLNPRMVMDWLKDHPNKIGKINS